MCNKATRPRNYQGIGEDTAGRVITEAYSPRTPRAVTGARTSPPGCSEPARAIKEKHPLASETRRPSRNIPETRTVHKKSSLNRKGRNTSVPPIEKTHLAYRANTP